MNGETFKGVIVPKISSSGAITVDMGQPILDPPKVPTMLAPTVNGAAVDSAIDVSGKTYKSTAVSMGNPHSVCLCLLYTYIHFHTCTLHRLYSYCT